MSRKLKSIKRCPHLQAGNCPFLGSKDCNLRAEDCVYPKVGNNGAANEETIPSNKDRCGSPQTYLLIFALLGLTISLIVSHTINPVISDFWLWLVDVVKAICVSLLAGVILSWLVNIPQKFRDFSKLISTSLTSSEYLSGLSRGDLFRLRERVTSHLYADKSPNMPRGLLKLDGEICKLLEDPYYSIYRESVECHKPGSFEDVSGTDSTVNMPPDATLEFVKKDCYQNYTIENPFSSTHPIKANIGLNNYVYLPEGCELKKLFSIEKFEISIDGGDYEDIKHLIKVVYSRKDGSADISPNAVPYNAGFHLSLKNGEELTSDIIGASKKQIEKEQGRVDIPDIPNKPKNDCGKQRLDSAVDYECKQTANDVPLLVVCSKRVSVRFKYSMILPIDDNHFTKRLKYSTKSYRLDYSIEAENQRLVGQLFGPLVDQSQIEIVESNDDRRISIECFSWLLPRSGAFVVMSKR